MAIRTKVSRPFRASVKRKSTWVASATVTGTTTLAASASVLDQFISIDAAPILVGSTIIRTRGMWGIRSDQQTASEVILAGMGMAVVQLSAQAVGITAVPTPFTEEPADVWFVYDTLMSAFRFASGVGFEENSFQVHYFDSKAQRKVTDEEAVIVVIQNGTAVGLQYMIKFRQLYKLS